MYTIQADKPFNSVMLAMLKVQQQIATVQGTSYIVIGATARDILMTHVFGIPAARATYDVDFALALESWDQFARIKQAYIDTGDFRAVADKAHRLLYKPGELGEAYPLDLIPFGLIEGSEKTITWPPDMKVVMSVAGYAEALQSAIQVDVGDGLVVRVVSLPALAALKLLAWNERGLADSKDAQDLYYLLKHYEQAGNAARLSEQAYSLVAACEYDPALAGAALLGYDTRAALEDATRAQLSAILSDPAKRDRLVIHMDRSPGADSAIPARYLDQFEHGLGLASL